VLAGLEGITEELDPPPVLSGDLDAIGAQERERLGLDDVPRSLGEALDAFEADSLVRSVVSPDLRAGYSAMKRAEIDLLEGVDIAEACARYAELY
jgi:glutamine synthetase